MENGSFFYHGHIGFIIIFQSGLQRKNHLMGWFSDGLYFPRTLASAAYALYFLIYRFGAIQLHFQVVDFVPDVHILKHIPCKLAFEGFNPAF